MSHFAVMVFGDDVETQLDPYHEFECTGVDDEFVQDIDKTEELRQRYEKLTVTKIKDKEGNVFDTWDDRFYRDPTEEEMKKYNLRGDFNEFGKGIDYCCQDWGDGQGCRPKIKYLPEGYERIEVKDSELETFAEYCEDEGYPLVKFGEALDLEDEHKYGYTLLDEKGEVKKVIDRTNPNAKWDYWTEGGRYAGCWKRKGGKDGFVSGLKKEIDFAGMEEDAAKHAAGVYDRAAKAYPAMTWESWESIRSRITDIEEARKVYHGQEAIKALSNQKFGFFFSFDELLVGREAYIQKAKDDSCRPYAFVKDGKWYAVGEMGWFGCSGNEDKEAFNAEFKKAIEEADDETRITIVDCHI